MRRAVPSGMAKFEREPATPAVQGHGAGRRRGQQRSSGCSRGRPAGTHSGVACRWGLPWPACA